MLRPNKYLIFAAAFRYSRIPINGRALLLGGNIPAIRSANFVAKVFWRRCIWEWKFEAAPVKLFIRESALKHSESVFWWKINELHHLLFSEVYFPMFTIDKHTYNMQSYKFQRIKNLKHWHLLVYTEKKNLLKSIWNKKICISFTA